MSATRQLSPRIARKLVTYSFNLPINLFYILDVAGPSAPIMHDVLRLKTGPSGRVVGRKSWIRLRSGFFLDERQEEFSNRCLVPQNQDCDYKDKQVVNTVEARLRGVAR